MEDTKFYYGCLSSGKEISVRNSKLGRYSYATIYSDKKGQVERFLKYCFKDTSNSEVVEIDYSIQEAIENNTFDEIVEKLLEEKEKIYADFCKMEVMNYLDYIDKAKNIVYKHRIFVIYYLDKVITRKNYKNFFERLVLRCGGAGFGFVFVCSNRNNKLVNFIYADTWSKIIFNKSLFEFREKDYLEYYKKQGGIKLIPDDVKDIEINNDEYIYTTISLLESYKFELNKNK